MVHKTKIKKLMNANCKKIRLKALQFSSEHFYQNSAGEDERAHITIT